VLEFPNICFLKSRIRATYQKGARSEQEAFLSSNEEGSEPPQADQAAQADPAPAAIEAGSATATGGERVGYGRPPVASRFRPGRSGNPRGRPRVERSLSAIVAAALRQRITVTENGGRVRHMSKLEATVRQIVNSAVEGEPRSTKLLFALIKADERLAAGPAAKMVSEADAIVIAELRRRLRSGPKILEARVLQAKVLEAKALEAMRSSAEKPDGGGSGADAGPEPGA
jgi:hypothetical protein